jgi:pimeloyl-ACP methyl ester carboxylesterase
MKRSKKNNVLKTALVLVLPLMSILSCTKNDQVGIVDYHQAAITQSNSASEARLVDYHQTAVTQFVTVGETNFAYRILGNNTGIPLVMVPALGFSMDDWDPAITNGLAQFYKVIIFDIEGAGSSSGTTPNSISGMAQGVVSFIRALGYNKVNLMGFSLGSFISQQIVLTEPALVNKLILTVTGPKGAEGLSNLPNILGSLAGLSPEDFLLQFAFTSSPASINAGKRSYERIQKRTVDRDTPVSPSSLFAGIIAVLGWAQPYPNAFNELQNITQPVFIVQGESDLPVPVINAINMSENIPNEELNVYPNAGHAAIFQYPERFVPAALHFLSN